jgi:hypothetical protein
LSQRDKFLPLVAKAVNLPVIEVLRRAGIENTEGLGNQAEEIKDLFSQLTIEDQTHIRQQIQVMLEVQRRADPRLSSKKNNGGGHFLNLKTVQIGATHLFQTDFLHQIN